MLTRRQRALLLRIDGGFAHCVPSRTTRRGPSLTQLVALGAVRWLPKRGTRFPSRYVITASGSQMLGWWGLQ